MLWTPKDMTEAPWSWTTSIDEEILGLGIGGGTAFLEDRDFSSFVTSSTFISPSTWEDSVGSSARIVYDVVS